MFLFRNQKQIFDADNPVFLFIYLHEFTLECSHFLLLTSDTLILNDITLTNIYYFGLLTILKL